jgi:hypothetical protein
MPELRKERKTFAWRKFKVPLNTAAATTWKTPELAITNADSGREPINYAVLVHNRWARTAFLKKRFSFLRKVSVLRLLRAGSRKILVKNFSLLKKSKVFRQPQNFTADVSGADSLKNFLSYNRVSNLLVTSAAASHAGSRYQLAYFKLFLSYRDAFNFRPSKLKYFDKTAAYRAFLLRKQARGLFGLSNDFNFVSNGIEQEKIANFFKKELGSVASGGVHVGARYRKHAFIEALRAGFNINPRVAKEEDLVKKVSSHPQFDDFFAKWLKMGSGLKSVSKKKNLVFLSKRGSTSVPANNLCQSAATLKKERSSKIKKRLTRFFMGSVKMRGAFILEFRLGRKFNTLSLYTRKKKLVCSRSTKSLGFKKKMRTDLLKTSYTFCRIFSIFKYYVFSKFRIKSSLVSHNFMIYLKGDRVKTLKVFKYFTDRIPIKFVGVFDKTSVTHNGCRLSKKRRRKNKGKNKFSRKNIRL